MTVIQRQAMCFGVVITEQKSEDEDAVSKQEWIDAMMSAFDEAADGVESWEYGGAESQEDFDLHRNAAREVAKRIRRMAWRFYKKASADNG